MWREYGPIIVPMQWASYHCVLSKTIENSLIPQGGNILLFHISTARATLKAYCEMASLAVAKWTAVLGFN